MRTIKKKIALAVLSSTFVLTLYSASTSVNGVPEKAYAAQDFTTTETIAVQAGASIYISDENASGIRFQTNVNKTWYDGLTGEKVAGSIVVPVEYVNAVEGDFTLQKLVDVVEANEAPFKAVETAELAEKEGHYSYALSMTEVLEANYARQFVAISYVKNAAGTATVEGIAEENATKWGLDNGNYYVAYDAENVRSIYNVSYNILNTDDAKANEKAAAKTYADKVLDIKEVDGELVIANNIDGKYVSPYTLNATGATVYNGKNVVLNGARATEADFPIEVGAKSVHITKTQNATFEGEEMTLQGAIPTEMVGPSQLTSLDGSNGDIPKNIGYYALNGSYGVGTYLDMSFTGKNIPSVMFFADKINGDLSQKGGKGLIILNGGESAQTGSTTDKGVHFSNIVKVAGPTRVTSEALAGWVRVSDTFASTSVTGQAKQVTGLGKFAYANLDDNGNYRYIIGTFEKDGNVWLEVGLYNNGFKVEQITFDTNLTTSQFTAGSIMAFATLKKDADNNPVDTTFTFNGILDAYPEIAAMKKGGAGAVVNADGSFTLSDITLANDNIGTVRLAEVGYVGWEGEYGVNTYAEFEFTGNNMPQLCFFADEVNGWMTSGNSTGIAPSTGKNEGFMFLNGLVANSYLNGFSADKLYGYGMYRAYWGQSGHSQTIFGANSSDDGVKAELAACLSQSALETNGNVTYRMVIGTSVAEGKLWLNIYLFNAETNVRIFGANLMTEYATTDGSELKGGIIAMAGLKNGETTTFKVTKAPATIDQFDIVGAAES